MEHYCYYSAGGPFVCERPVVKPELVFIPKEAPKEEKPKEIPKEVPKEEKPKEIPKEVPKEEEPKEVKPLTEEEKKEGFVLISTPWGYRRRYWPYRYRYGYPYVYGAYPYIY